MSVQRLTDGCVTIKLRYAPQQPLSGDAAPPCTSRVLISSCGIPNESVSGDPEPKLEIAVSPRESKAVWQHLPAGDLWKVQLTG